MASFSNDPLLQAWEKTLARHAQRPALFDARGEVQRTFREVENEARELADNFLAKFSDGEVIAIQLGNHVSWPALLLAIWRRGLVALPLEKSVSEQERDAALEICHARALVTAGPEIAVTLLENAAVDWEENPPVLLKLTSGTTAAPRAIRFRGAQLLADCEQICDSMGIGGSDRNFGVIPFSHSYGLSNLITPLLARGVSLIVSRDLMPRAMLEDLARAEATVFPGMPVFFQAFCDMPETPALPNLRLCISAGAPLPMEVARKFREKFQQPIHSFYGSSECGGICFDAEVQTLEQGFVGRALRGVELETQSASGEASRVAVRSAAVGDGYFPNLDQEKLGGGKFLPDDLLIEKSDGYRIVGRVSDVINVAGKKVNPAEVEAELLRFEGVRAAVVFGRDSSLRNEEVAACVVAEEHVREPALLEFCRRRLSGWQVPKRIFFVETIPVNERGKVNRRALARDFATA